MLSLEDEYIFKQIQSLKGNYLSPFFPQKSWPLGVSSSTGFFEMSFNSRILPQVKAHAVDITPLQTIIRSLGESCERYCSHFYDKQKIILKKSHAEMAKKYELKSPELYNLHAKFQYEELYFDVRPYTLDLVQDWVPAKNLTKQLDTYVPLSTVHYTGRKSDVRVQKLTSNGMAAGSSPEMAITNALLELIERDAILYYWRNRQPGQLIAPSVLNHPALSEITSKLPPSNLKSLQLVYLPTDINIPVVMALFFGQNPAKEPGFFMTGGCGLNPLAAISSALKEFLQLKSYCTWAYQKNPQKWQQTMEVAAVNDFMDHTHFYFNYEQQQKCQFLIQEKNEISLEKMSIIPNSHLDGILQHLKENDLEVLACELTTRDVQAMGYYVYRCLVPGLLQIDSDHRYSHLGGERLYNLGLKLGHRKQPLTIADLNSAPHPFP